VAGFTEFLAAGHTRGVCVTCGEPARNEKAFYCDEHTKATPKKKSKSSPRPRASHPAEPVPEGSAPDPVDGSAGPLYSSDERRPTEGKAAGRTLGSRLFRGKDQSAGAPPSKRRVSTSGVWSDAVGGVAALAGNAGYVPLGRAMVWSSPVAGEIIEDATKGTPVDRIIQPIARNGEKWQDLFDLLGLWAAVGVAQANPAQANQALNFARKRFVSLLPRIAANIKKQREKEREAVEAVTELMPDIADLFPDGQIPEGEDPINALIMALFAPPPGAMVEEPVGV
jgi:hypothetical protein